MFPQSEDVQELVRGIEAVVAEIDVAMGQLTRLETMVDGGAAQIVKEAKRALRNAQNEAGDMFSNIPGPWSEGFPWSYEESEFLAYLAKRDELYGGAS